MKKILSILFLLLFIYNLIGYYAVFTIMRYQIRADIKHQMKYEIPQEELVKITLSFQELEDVMFFDEDKEFLYKGKMYDIVKQENTHNCITYYCIDDVNESKLFANLDQHIETYLVDNPINRTKTENILKKLLKDYYFEESSSKQTQLNTGFSYNTFTINFNSVDYDVASPPPKVV